VRPLERRIRQLMWVALFIATCIYGVVDFIVIRPLLPLHTFEDELRTPVVLVLYALAIVAFVIGRSIAVSSRNRYTARLALMESCAIFGLVAAFVLNDWRLYFPTWVLSAIGFLQTFPPRVEERYTPGL
jgi:cation transport ATPase